MPLLTLATNLPRAAIPQDFFKQAAEVLHKALGKPLERISVIVNPDQMMSFGGSEEPCALMTITAIGGLGAEVNKKVAEPVFKLIKDMLNIEGKRAYITFHDIEGYNVAHDGKTRA